ncbi:MAG: radical SAM protein [Candidatus Hydrogenedentes bacterium]|nr:radical SAM protein [Candidatus Hydrogenedentota bacterium]
MKRFKLLLVSLGHRTISFPFTTPPMGVLSLAAYIRQQFPGAEIRVVDQRVLNCSVDELLRHVVEFEPDVTGFSCLTSFAYLLGPLTRKVRESLPETLQVIGGPHASAFRASALEGNAADVAVVGEGELALEKLILSYLDGALFENVPGLVWRDTSGQIVENPPGEPIVDLDSLPFPAYDLINMDLYWKLAPMAALPARRYVSFFTSRGCPYHCIYCHNIFGKHFRGQSAERMAAEVEYFTRKYNVREIEFLDDMFNFSGQRLLDFCGLIGKRGVKLRINLPNSIRTDILTEEHIDALVDTGLYHASFALETASPRLQKLIKKNLNIPKFLENVERATRKGVFANGFTMLGFPTETEEELKLTIDTACESSFHTATFFTVIPYPQTALYELARQTYPEQLAEICYDASDYHGIRTNFSEVPDEVFLAYQRYAWRHFFLNPKRMWRIVRDFPDRRYLPHYLPVYLRRQMKGVFDGFHRKHAEKAEA